MDEEKLSQGIQFLAGQGLNLYAVFDCTALPADIAEMLAAEDIPLDTYRRLVLLGHGGRQFWTALQIYGMRTADPVDHFSLVMARRFIDDYLEAAPSLILYPTASYVIPLQRLGTQASWSHPSPLGLGISPEFGVWFAYRVAFLTTLPLPVSKRQPSASPCDACRDKPCISACPAQAVRASDAFDLPKCVDFRLAAGSVCADRCLSRLACPYFPEHRYSPEQVRYHYLRSLEAVRLYQAGDGSMS